MKSALTTIRTTLCLTLLVCSANGCAGLHNSELQRTFWALLSSEQLQGMTGTNAREVAKGEAAAIADGAANEVGGTSADFAETLEQITKVRDALVGGRGAEAVQVSRQVIPGLPSANPRRSVMHGLR